MCKTRGLGMFMLICVLGLTGCSKSESTFNTVGQSLKTVGGSPSVPQRDGGRDVVARVEPDAREKAVLPPPEAAMARAEVGHERMAPTPVTNLPQSGILTAGSFDDNLDPRFYQSFIRRNLGWNSPAASRFTGQRLIVLVKDESGRPVGNARVTLTSAGHNPVTLSTRSNGQGVFLSSFDQYSATGTLSVRVSPPSGPTKVEQLPAGSTRWEVTVKDTQAALPRQLDLALVIDTTGSMGDELRFLQSELRSIAATIRAQYPDVEQRYALIVYRDDGDQYVTRRFDFTSDLDDFCERLVQQKAEGGGDQPEAMHRALADAAQLSWRSDDTARVLFLIGDAPPHRQWMNATFASANQLRQRGVVLYPVACSGYDPSTELVMRTCALLSGGQFLFLTDDSGVGNAHAAAQVPFHHVQRLDHLMIRMIASELAGKPVPARQEQIIRTVGRPINE
ncbi:MAG: VWA domain-containing protein [Gemmataceae bacterium]